MPTALQNLVIFGDSLSDIGNKREAPTGWLARAAKLMRTNEIGRYSDGKNWTDFLIEWAGAQSLVLFDRKETEVSSAEHRSLSEKSFILGTNVGKSLPVRYVNYAEGGAIAASDWRPMAGSLGYLKDQVAAYIKQRRGMGSAFTGNTLHIIWIGLNDIITAERWGVSTRALSRRSTWSSRVGRPRRGRRSIRGFSNGYGGQPCRPCVGRPVGLWLSPGYCLCSSTAFRFRRTALVNEWSSPSTRT
jgi:phospholipase/lecithinase/hemolysin